MNLVDLLLPDHWYGWVGFAICWPIVAWVVWIIRRDMRRQP